MTEIWSDSILNSSGDQCHCEHLHVWRALLLDIVENNFRIADIHVDAIVLD